VKSDSARRISSIKTSIIRFNLSTAKEYFINPDCFGEDLAAWLRDKLTERGTDVPHVVFLNRGFQAAL